MRRRITPSSERRRRRRIRAHATAGACKKASRNIKNGGRASSSKVSDKLEALKNLIPVKNGEIVKADKLFEETADYIVRLRTQVFILQRLIQVYGSTESEDNDNAVS